MAGFITLDRKLTKNWLWEEKPFSKGQAWIDLLFLVNYEDNTFPHGNEIVTIKRGSHLTSISKLADRWGWSRKKVYDFLKVTEKEQMLYKKSNTKETVVTIVKYDDYQLSGNTKETPKKHRGNTEETPKDTKKEIKEIKEINIKDSSRFTPPTLLEVQAYCKERNNLIDAEKFIAHYESNGWMVGKVKMRSWKSAVITWEKSEKKPTGSNTTVKPNKFNQFPQRTYTEQDYAELEKKLLNKGQGG